MEIQKMRLIRLPQVLVLTGLGRSTLLDMVRRGDFPPPIRIGIRAVAWRLCDVVAWIETRPQASETHWA